MIGLLKIVRGFFVFSLLALNLAVVGTIIFCLGLIKMILPRHKRTTVTRLMLSLATDWSYRNNWLLDLFRLTQWEIRGVENLKLTHNYVAVANHQSWIDIVAILYITNQRAPFFRFFLKNQLKYFPFVGMACWALDFPFMKRYSAEYLAKHPEKAGEDFATTRTACNKFKGNPVTFINFVEGTRCTAAKQKRQNSPYRHLLRPKAGGIATVIGVMGENLHELLNITIIYPDNRKHIWQFIFGRVSKIIVVVETLPIPQQWIGRDYRNDPEFRTECQQWINALWQQKDNLITQELANYFKK